MAAAARIAVTAGIWVLLGVGAGLAVCVTLPSLFGYPALTVLSGSMEPALEVGSVVIDERISPLQARRGDIVTFSDPARPSRVLTHRLRYVRVERETAYMTTRGDANDTPERWSVPVGGEIGRVAYRVPKLGYVRGLISTRAARLGVIGLVFLLGLYLLIDIWRPRPRRGADPEQAR